MSNILSPNDESVVLYLPFSEGSGSTAYDYSNSRNDGTISGATYVKVSDGGYAIKGAGSSDTLIVNDDTSLHLGNEGMVLFWIKMNTIVTGDDIIQKNKIGNFNGDFLVNFTNSTTIRFTQQDGTNTRDLTYDGLVTNSWFHIACGVDSSQIPRLFINGVEKTNGSALLNTLNMLGNDADFKIIHEDFDGLIRFPTVKNVYSEDFVKKHYQETYIQ